MNGVHGKGAARGLCLTWNRIEKKRKRTLWGEKEALFFHTRVMKRKPLLIGVGKEKT